MSAEDRVERLFEDYQRHRAEFAEMQQKMRDLSATATSPRREVSVTVGQNGVLTDIQFPSGAHKRLTPAELTGVILATYGNAKTSVLDRAAELLAPLLPEGLDAKALVTGTAGPDAFLPPEPRMTTSVRELLSNRLRQQ